MSKPNKEKIGQQNPKVINIGGHNKEQQSIKSAYLIVGVIAFSQGILGLSDLALNYLYKDDFQMSPAEVSMTTSIISLPWILKPCWGIISDSVSLFGYRRKSYLIIFSFFGFLLWQVMAQIITSKTAGIIILLLINVSVAFCNVIGEALIVEISQKRAKQLNLPDEQAQAEASKNVSIFFGLRSGGTLITAFLSGELLEMIGKRQIFAITSLFPLTLLLVALFLEEEKQHKSKPKQEINNSIDKEQEELLKGEEEIEIQQKQECNDNNTSNFKQSIKVSRESQIRKIYNFVSLKEIYRPIFFIFFFMLVPSPGSSMFYFYTNELHFSPEFLGSLRFIYASGSILSVLIYNRYLKQVSFSSQFITTTIICILLGYSQILLVTRDNLRLGIPDKLFTLGDSVIIQIVGEINTMPLLVLACRMCPKDIEGTMYALLMSTLNLGGILSGELGGLLTYWMNITESNFDNLWLLLFITNTLQLLPLLMINMIDTKKIQQIQDQNSNCLLDSISQDDEKDQEEQYLLQKEQNIEEKNPYSFYEGTKNYLSVDQSRQDHTLSLQDSNIRN